MNLNETRSSHPSSAQVETLVEFMERNPGMAKGFLRTQSARERSRRRLNSIGGTIKSYQKWSKNIQIEHGVCPPDPHTYHPSLFPPLITLSHTPTPSPSRRGATQVASPVIRRRTATSSSSRHATPIVSPTRRPRTKYVVRGSRGAGSVSSRHTSSVAAPPQSQRRTEFSTTIERFLRVEEQQLEIQRLNAQILQSFLERSAERDRILAEAVAAVGKGLQAFAEAKNRDRL